MDSMSESRRLDLGLVVLRLVAGAIFLAHGGQKIFVTGFGGVITGFSGLGIPLPAVVGTLVALIEFFGAVALSAGLLTRSAALALAGVMLGAIFVVHWKSGFFAPRGIEFPLSLLGICVALALAGPGTYSVDRVIARRERS